MQKTKRKSAVVIATLSLIALLLVSLTLAFLTDQKSILNIIGLGGNGDGGTNPSDQDVYISLDEPNFLNSGAVQSVDSVTGETRYTLANVGAGDSIQKDPTVTAVGVKDIYVRVQLQYTNASGSQVIITPDNANSGILSKLSFTINPDWTFHNGYYYYTAGTANGKALSTGQTASIFVEDANRNTITVSTSLNNQDVKEINNALNIRVIGQAIGAENFNPNLASAGDGWNGEEVMENTIGQ